MVLENMLLSSAARPAGLSLFLVNAACFGLPWCLSGTQKESEPKVGHETKEQ